MSDHLMTSAIQRAMLRHFLAALAYRTQKALRGASPSFGEYRAGPGVRTPIELVRHMTGVVGYARTFFIGGSFTATPLAYLDEEISRFHATLEQLASDLEGQAEPVETTLERLLQGPLSDAMTHAGQLAMLRRLAGDPIPPENFLKATITPGNLGSDQPEPVAYGNRHGKWNRDGTPDA